MEAFGRAVLVHGGLESFASNAGYLAADSAEDIFSLTGAEIRKYFDVNTIGPTLATREAARITKQQGLGGSIICNAAKTGYLSGPGRLKDRLAPEPPWAGRLPPIPRTSTP